MVEPPVSLAAVHLPEAGGRRLSGGAHHVERETAWHIQLRVLRALVLRDMRTRFGRSYFGYVIMVLWPLSHLLTLLIVYNIAKRVAPIGSDLTTFFATGVLPYILCLYPARFMMLAIVTNKPLLGFPIVKTTDLIIARVIVEVYTAMIVTVLFLLILAVFGVDIVPINVVDAVLGVLATVYFAVGLGALSAVLFGLTRAWLAAFVGSIIVMYFTSGAMFLNSALPKQYLYWLSFNPMFQSVEWLRAAYYEGYGEVLLSRSYLVGYATVLLFLALVIEKAARGRLLMIQ